MNHGANKTNKKKNKSVSTRDKESLVSSEDEKQKVLNETLDMDTPRHSLLISAGAREERFLHFFHFKKKLKRRFLFWILGILFGIGAYGGGLWLGHQQYLEIQKRKIIEEMQAIHK